MRILAVDAGAKGQLLLERWAVNGHSTSTISVDALAASTEPIEADVILTNLTNDHVSMKMISSHLAGKVIVDCVNVTSVSALRSGSASAVEELARLCPAAKAVKALNVITTAALQDVLRHGGDHGQEGYSAGYYCGDDDDARRSVASLIEETHLDPIDCGPLSNATLLDGLGILAHQLEETFGPHFSIGIIRKRRDTSPLDRWM